MKNTTQTAQNQPSNIVFYAEWHEALRELPDEMRLRAYDSLFEFAFVGEEPTDVILRAITSIMRATIRRNKEKYNQKVERMNRNRAAAAERRAATEKRSDSPTPAPKPLPEPASAPEPVQEQESVSTQAINTFTPNDLHDIELRAQFKDFLDKYPDAKRGFDVEFDNLVKVHGDKWREIVPQLLPGLTREMTYRQKVRATGGFLPNMPGLSRWIRESRWETVHPAVQACKQGQPVETPRPYTLNDNLRHERDEHDARVDEMRAGYRRRIPGAFTDRAPVTFAQYMIDHCPEMTDAQLTTYLAAIAG